MKNFRVICLLLLAIYYPNLFGQTVINFAPQTIDSTNYNAFDSSGNKMGPWYEISDNVIELSHYISGKKDGVYRCYVKRKDNLWRLAVIENYKNDVQVGQALYFHDNGNIAMIQDSISENTEFRDRTGYLNPDGTPSQMHKCYLKNYDEKSGKIHSEGWYIYPAGAEIEMEGEEVGKWIFYTPDGSSYIVEY